MRPLLRILGLWRGQAGWLVAGLGISMASVAAGVALMTASSAMVARVGSPAMVSGVAGLVVAPMLVRVLGPARVILRYAERLATHAATFRALAALRVWFFRGLAVRSAGGLGFRRAGDALARLVGDVEALDGLYLRFIIPLAASLLLFSVLIIIMLALNRILALIVGSLFFSSVLVMPVWAAGRTFAAGERLSMAFSDLRVASLDAIFGLKEVRAFAAEGRMLAAVQASEAALFRTQREISRRAAWASAASFLCGQAAVLAVVAMSGATPRVTIPLAFLTVAAFEVVSGLSRAGVLAGHAAASAQRVLEAAESKLAVPEPLIPASLPVGTSLRFESVDFAWQADRRAVFSGVSLEIPAGARVAILGPSGAGKSTLAALALKVVAPQNGRVLLGDVDLTTLSAADVRSRVSWLGQTTHLFNDTIRANLRLGRPSASECELWAALDQAEIGCVIRALPAGLETWVGEGGARLSGGQGRRLALARALLSQAPILILDEPATGLDAAAERAFLATLNEVAPGRTVILIVHRLTGIERLDRIWRLSSGGVMAAAA